MLFRALEPWHLLIILLILVILFGGKRLPDAARGLGRSLRILKSEVNQLHDDAPKPPAPAPLEGNVMPSSETKPTTQQHDA
jgi:sec-independent protein translocase protein TatA